jgi:cytosine/adenosine deaminase-related metal-dependent hydrolase
MDRARATATIELHGAATVAPPGTTREPLRIRGGRIAAAPGTGAGTARIALDGHCVFPGLVNAHDHLHVNAVPPLPSRAPFPNSYAWIEAFGAHFAEPAVAAALAVPKDVRLRHGALKNLLAGTTCVAHHDPWHPVFEAADFPVAVVHDHGWAYAPGWPGYGPGVRESFLATPPDRPWMIHLAEGTDAVAAAEFGQLDALGCVAPNSILVHGVGMGAADVARAIARGASVAWCPASNLALLGRSLDPRPLHAAGRLALGTDSRLSGARDLLDEMRGILARGELEAAHVLDIATAAAARILRMPGHGGLAAGDRADLVVVRDDRGAGPAALAGRRRRELRAVVRGGAPCIADPDLADWFALAGVDTVAATLDGAPKLLARWLADPAVVALEPGLELAAAASAAQPARAVATGS